MTKVKILNIPVDVLSFEQAVSKIIDLIERGKKFYTVTVNPEFILLAQKDKEFFTILKKATFSLADGYGLIFASFFNFLLGREKTFLKQRVSGIHLMERLCQEASKKNWRAFFLGGRSNSAQITSQIFQKKYLGLKVAGFFAGNGSSKGDRATVSQIKKSKPIDILFVAFGPPKQEKWLKRNLSKVSVKFTMGVGGSFDLIAGVKVRSPKIISSLCLDWLWRLIFEPKRLPRTIRSLIVFPLKVILTGSYT